MKRESLDLLERGVDLFNRREFFEAHEIWEDAWRMETGEARQMLQGLIQVAAGFVKLQRGRPRATVDLLGRGAARLAALPPRFGAVDLDPLLESVAAWREIAGRMLAAGVTDYDQAALPRLALRDRQPA